MNTSFEVAQLPEAEHQPQDRPRLLSRIRVHAIPGRADISLLRRLLRNVPVVFARFGTLLVKYNQGHRRQWLDSIGRVYGERALLLNPAEACAILSAVRATAKVPGDLAEVGVFAGASAKLIREYAPPEKTLHLFDTFAGLPEPSKLDNPVFRGGQYAVALEEVRSYLNEPSVRLYKGVFPSTSEPVSGNTFSFVHLDVDLYESTKACLEWFYPRMTPGGIIVSHDYLGCAGVNRAFEEFFHDRPEPVIETAGDQCLVVKLQPKNSR